MVRSRRLNQINSTAILTTRGKIGLIIKPNRSGRFNRLLIARPDDAAAFFELKGSKSLKAHQLFGIVTGSAFLRVPCPAAMLFI
jgi:hypothetical protein